MARRKNCPASLMSAYVRESGSGSSRQEGVVGVGLESTLKGRAFSMRTITSFGVLSVAKIMGAIYAVIGLILLPFFLLASLIGSMAGGHDNPLGAIGGVTFALFAPIFYGALRFVFGAISAFLYHFMVTWLARLEVHAPRISLQPTARSRTGIATRNSKWMLTQRGPK